MIVTNRGRKSVDIYHYVKCSNVLRVGIAYLKNTRVILQDECLLSPFSGIKNVDADAAEMPGKLENRDKREDKTCITEVSAFALIFGC